MTPGQALTSAREGCPHQCDPVTGLRRLSGATPPHFKRLKCPREDEHQRTAALLLQHVPVAERRGWDKAFEEMRDLFPTCSSGPEVSSAMIVALQKRGPADAD